MTDRELLQQAADALDEHGTHYLLVCAIRAQIAQPEQEPVVFQYRMKADWNKEWGAWDICSAKAAGDYESTPTLHDWHFEVRRLYTAPQPALKPLTEEMITAAARELCKIHAGECQIDEQDTWKFYSHQFKRDAQAAIEAAHGIKGK